ncbi:unnamed protein product [Ranitomeya imitator]|uniref:AT-rich interactive domain-containing protein 3 n=1 Tax=Ranitomeya imitator TaxID=111125 RepID=A0ABN9LWW0_9NEOB|nr:unnamed protein product [Ranitomeya imitator]
MDMRRYALSCVVRRMRYLGAPDRARPTLHVAFYLHQISCTYLFLDNACVQKRCVVYMRFGVRRRRCAQQRKCERNISRDELRPEESSSSFLRVNTVALNERSRGRGNLACFVCPVEGQVPGKVIEAPGACKKRTPIGPETNRDNPWRCVRHLMIYASTLQLYELDSDPKRKEFLDDLFVFMQKKGTPISRIPIMAKQLLDLYMLYKLVTEKGGLVEVINKKIWREITKGLNLPTSITSAAFTLRTQYMKYLYLYECEKKSLSSPAELQAAIDGNRREGRRPSYGTTSFSYSPTPAGPTPLLGAPKLPVPMLGVHPTSRMSPVTPLKKGDSPVSILPNRISMASGALSMQQTPTGVRTSSVELLKERPESGEPPEKRASRPSVEEQQRLMQQAFQHNLLNMARQIPMKLKINGKAAQDRQDTSLNLGTGSINMSIEINGTMYTGELEHI